VPETHTLCVPGKQCTSRWYRYLINVTSIFPFTVYIILLYLNIQRFAYCDVFAQDI